MDYRVIATIDAERDLERHVRYLLLVKKSEQAAKSVLDDYDETIGKLSEVAGSLKFCTNPKLKAYGYKRINFQKHRYFMLFRIVDDYAVIDNIFHELEDFENKIR